MTPVNRSKLQRIDIDILQRPRCNLQRREEASTLRSPTCRRPAQDDQWSANGKRCGTSVLLSCDSDNECAGYEKGWPLVSSLRNTALILLSLPPPIIGISVVTIALPRRARETGNRCVGHVVSKDSLCSVRAEVLRSRSFSRLDTPNTGILRNKRVRNRRLHALPVWVHVGNGKAARNVRREN